MIDVKAKIEELNYEPTLCDTLETYSLQKLYSGDALSNSSFIVNTKDNQYAVSTWVTPKRTRSYPRARVYNTYKHNNRVTILPLVKDEGKDGDRDYLQWDTLSLMSLLQVNVIVAPYKHAEKNEDYNDKITNQRYDYEYIKKQFDQLQKHQSDALHWNLKQASNLDKVSQLTEEYYYNKISSEADVEMHSKKHFKKRMQSITKKAKEFKEMSRGLAEEAQNRESLTLQPKESVKLDKGRITIQDHLGGEYYFTTDEIMVENGKVYLIEKKHTRNALPSPADIKNGLVRMMLFKNLNHVQIEGEEYEAVPILGVTGDDLEGQLSNSDKIENDLEGLSKRKKKEAEDLLEEADRNDFTVIVSENSEKEKNLYEQIK